MAPAPAATQYLDLLKVGDLETVSFPFHKKTTLSNLHDFIQAAQKGTYQLLVDEGKLVTLTERFVRQNGGEEVRKFVTLSQSLPFRKVSEKDPSECLLLNIKSLTGKVVMADMTSASTVEEVKELFHDKEGIPPGQQRLIYKGKQLEDGRLINEYGIRNNSTVHMLQRLVGGGMPLADISREDAKVTHRVTCNGPARLTVSSGLHLEGMCRNADCSAHKKTVISRHGIGRADVTEMEGTCPMCYTTFRAISIGFYNCFYRVRALKSGLCGETHIAWTKVADGYQTWDAKRAGVVEWDLMKVETRSLGDHMCERVPHNKRVPLAPVAAFCAICMGPQAKDSGDGVRMLSCSHSFHPGCMRQWEETLASRGEDVTCPLCRDVVVGSRKRQKTSYKSC